jgi:hypothetical protein
MTNINGRYPGVGNAQIPLDNESGCNEQKPEGVGWKAPKLDKWKRRQNQWTPAKE